MINQTISHYKILEKLGEGGMGEVYLAEDTALDRKVALKFLPPHASLNADANTRFQREAKAAAALNHPNIITVYEIGEHEGRAFIAMEYIKGQSLREKIKSATAPLPIHEVINLISQVYDGLAAAHQAGITHRDLKPENLMIDANGRVKILDFGLAKLKGVTKLTAEATTLGTISYMSPEQTQGEEVDHRTDIWSIGVVLYEMITGQLPFKAEYEMAVVYSILNEGPKPITQLRNGTPIGLVQIVSRSLEKQLGSRYQSISELLEDLSNVTKDRSWHPSSKPMRLAPTRLSAFWRNRKHWGIVVGMLLFILLGALFPPTNRLAKRWLGFADIPTQKHLLVLPLTNVGGDDGNQAFCDGVMETLTSKLTQLEQFQGALWVVPTSEVRKGGIESASEAHQAFGVNLVVSGSLQKIDERFRLTLNLIDAKNLRQLSSTVIDNRMSNLATLQDQTVIKMAQMLDVELHPQTRATLTLGETRVAEAYESYLQGRGYLQHYDKIENIDRAIGLFTQAIEQDSLYALAFAGLGEAYWRKYEAIKDAQLAEKAVLFCERAASLNNKLAPVNVTLGLIHTGTGRYEQAVEAFNRSLSIDPANADAYRGLASAYEAQGKLEGAESTYKKAIELKPDYWAGYSVLGIFYYRHGHFEKAVGEFRHVIELVPQSAKGYRNLGSMYFFLNRNVEAIQMWERSLEIEPTYSVYSNLATLYYYEGRYTEAARMYEKALEFNDRDYQVWGNLATAYYRAPGEREKATQTYQRALQLAEEKRKVNPRDPEVLLDIATYYNSKENNAKIRSLLQQVIALKPDQVNLFFRIAATYEKLDERDLALQWLTKALDNGYPLTEIERFPGFKKLRADARYQQLLKRIKKKARQDDK